jgi:hypothetical protein
MVYNNYIGAIITPTFDHANGCAAVSLGFLNHFEIQVSQTHIDVYGSDFSTDNGATFANYKLLHSANINLPFTRAYVHFRDRFGVCAGDCGSGSAVRGRSSFACLSK